MMFRAKIGKVYVCMYVFLYLVGLRIIQVAKKHKNGMFLNADHYTAVKQSG